MGRIQKTALCRFVTRDTIEEEIYEKNKTQREKELKDLGEFGESLERVSRKRRSKLEHLGRVKSAMFHLKDARNHHNFAFLVNIKEELKARRVDLQKRKGKIEEKNVEAMDVDEEEENIL